MHICVFEFCVDTEPHTCFSSDFAKDELKAYRNEFAFVSKYTENSI